MKILIVSHVYPSEATPFFGTFVQNQAKALQASGFQVNVISPLPHALPGLKRLKPGFEKLFSVPFQTIDDGIGVYHPRFWPLSKWGSAPRKISYNAAIKAAFDVLPQKPDLIIVRFGLQSADSVADLGCPFIIYEESSEFVTNSPKSLQKQITTYFKADQVFSVSSFLQSKLQQLGINSIVLPNVLPQFEKIKTKLPEKFTILMIANYDKALKRIDSLIALAKLLPMYQFLIFGVGKKRAYWQQIAKQENLTNILLNGPLLPKKISEAYQNAHILLSLSSTETFGMTLIEAMAHGLPVIATNSGGPSDFITPPHQLVPQNNLNAIVIAIEDLANNYHNINHQNIIDIVENNFGLNTWIGLFKMHLKEKYEFI